MRSDGQRKKKGKNGKSGRVALSEVAFSDVDECGGLSEGVLQGISYFIRSGVFWLVVGFPILQLVEGLSTKGLEQGDNDFGGCRQINPKGNFAPNLGENFGDCHGS